LVSTASLTAINVSHNNTDQPSARLILEAMRGKDMQSISMAGCNLGVEEAKILAEYVRVMTVLTKASLPGQAFCCRLFGVGVLGAWVCLSGLARG